MKPASNPLFHSQPREINYPPVARWAFSPLSSCWAEETGKGRVEGIGYGMGDGVEGLVLGRGLEGDLLAYYPRNLRMETL